MPVQLSCRSSLRPTVVGACIINALSLDGRPSGADLSNGGVRQLLPCTKGAVGLPVATERHSLTGASHDGIPKVIEMVSLNNKNSNFSGGGPWNTYTPGAFNLITFAGSGFPSLALCGSLFAEGAY